ncbi:hypothetical protein WJX73_004055 [Symbiochloris irregularis]|uniref:Uncharacterized protein n=1 Tax=Symbiochloris irregularis TaxID=706552 RepID=A0AAW1PFT9_9CHLO
MVVKLDASLQGVIHDVASQLRVGSSITLQSADEGRVSCTDVDGRIVGYLGLEQLQTLPLSVGGGEVRSLRKQQGVLSEVLVRFTDAPAQTAAPVGPQAKPAQASYEQSSTRLGRKRLERLVASDDLRSTLGDKRLQAAIQTIDGAADREKALEAALRTDPDFTQFCDKVLATLSTAA